MEKILPSIFAALLPFLFTYFSKKNKHNIRRNVLEEAQKRVDFIKTYFEALSTVSAGTEADSLKSQLAGELYEIKNNISALYKKEDISDYEKLNPIQKVFLTFKPASVKGWIWHILFSLNLILIFFLVIGLFVNDQSEFSSAQFSKNVQDPYLLLACLFYVGTLVLFNRLALMNYKKSSLHKAA